MDIVMPSLGADMEEGTLVEWLVNEGDTVQKGDIIAVIETQKGAIDMETFEAGTITSLSLQPVATVPVGTVMATMALEHPQMSPKLVKDAIEDETAAKKDSESPASVSEQKTGISSSLFIQSGIKASPLVRKIAAEQGIDLSLLAGSGPNGAVLLRDLPDAMPMRKVDATGMRKSIGAVMEKSKREIPHYYLTLDVDIGNTIKHLKRVNEQREPDQRLLLLALLLRATACALKRFPQFNGYYQQGVYQSCDQVHIGNAISLRSGGLVVPAIHSVERLSVDETMDALRDVIQRSRTGHLRSSELSDATVTVTSIGERGADLVMGVIYPPQVAIIGFGKPRKATVVEANAISISDRMTVSLSADHRVSDGIVGAKMLNALANFLQHPEVL